MSKLYLFSIFILIMATALSHGVVIIDKQGREIDAELLGLKNDILRIKTLPNGKEYKVLLSDLSDSSQQLVKSHFSKDSSKPSSILAPYTDLVVSGDDKSNAELFTFLDPAISLFGLKLGSTPDEATLKLGKPNAIYKSNKNTLSLVYNEGNVGLVYSKNKLVKVIISEWAIIPYELNKERTLRSSDLKPFTFADGIKFDMKPEKIEEKLGVSLSNNNGYLRTCTYMGLHITFSFSSMQNETIFKLTSISIEKQSR